jgi:hypothetical protein
MAMRNPALLSIPRTRAQWQTVMFFLCALFASAAARAQTVHWENGDSATGNLVQLVFEDCQPDGEPELPATPGVTLRRVGESNSFTANFGGPSVQSVILTYVVQARRGGSIQIPAFTVKTNKGSLAVPEFNSAAPAITADSVARSKLIPSRTTVWAGEVFDLTYQLTAARRNNPQINPTFEWNAAPLIAEDWSKPELEENIVGGQRQAVVTFRTRAYAKTPNTVKLEAATHLLNIQTGSVNFGLMMQPRVEPISVTSDQPTMEVRALPTPPAGFAGAVGQFKLTGKVVPDHAAVGEPVTWTLELSGTGNWPDISGLPSREVSKDFQVVQPKAKRAPVEGKLFDATLTEDVVLMPTKPGTYTLAPVKFIYFDPQSGAYKTLRTDGATITIAPPATPPQPTAPSNPTANSAASGDTQKAESAPAKPLQAPVAPAGIPRDPIAGSDVVPVPLTTRALVTWLLSPLAGLLVLWFALAWRRAARTDPLNPQREAYARLVDLLARMRSSSGGGGDARVSEQLLQWQHDAALLWQVRHAAPSAAALQQFGSSGADQWVALWREADRAIYGARAALPLDWIARAEAALSSKRVPGFKPTRLFLPRNLLPFAAVLAVLLSAPTEHLRAATDPIVTYRSGDFAEAEKAWRDVVAQHPTDWIARHNLALALAQQDRNGEAVAEAAAAFVQHPNAPSVKWHLELTANKAGFAPGALLPFLKEGPVASIATMAGPAGWQRWLIAAAFVVAAALAWIMINAYGTQSSRQYWIAGAVGGLAFIGGAIAIFGIVSYGDTIDTRAAVAWHSGTLRSIPTEADTTQKTTPLAAGSVAIVDRTFLGWDRLVFANGQTGWVRQEDIVLLWR